MPDEESDSDCSVTTTLPIYNESGRVGETVWADKQHGDTVLPSTPVRTRRKDRLKAVGATELTKAANQDCITV